MLCYHAHHLLLMHIRTSAWNSNASAPSFSCSWKVASMVDGATAASSATASPIPIEPPPTQRNRALALALASSRKDTWEMG